MGSASGYAYEYRFWVDDDIIHRYSCLNIRDDIKFLFEIRTNFRVRDSEGDGVIIDRERFEIGAENCSRDLVYRLMENRVMDDYFFSLDEYYAFTREACAFAAAAAVEHGQQQRRVIPIAVEMDICTVRQTGELRLMRIHPLKGPRALCGDTSSTLLEDNLSKEKIFADLEADLTFTREDLFSSSRILDNSTKRIDSMQADLTVTRGHLLNSARILDDSTKKMDRMQALLAKLKTLP